MKVFLCEHIHPDALALLRTRAEIISDLSRIAEADFIINRNLRLDASLLEQAVNLKAVAIHGTGTDGVDLACCAQRGIRVFSVPHENADSVAELIVAFALVLLRKLHLADRNVCAGAPLVNAPPQLSGSELGGKTLGLVGAGDIALRAARIMRDGFGVRVIGYSPSLTPQKAAALGIGCCATVEEVLQQADIVNIGVHRTPATENLIDLPRLRMMQPHAVLINTARGGVVNEQALYQALTEGIIAAAACDVFETEPPTRENPLVGLANFVATPHIGANTNEALRRVGMAVVEGIFAIMDGGEAAHPCTLP